MAKIHRHSDSRSCGATTIVSGQDTVFANGLLVSVDGDPNSHGAGNLNADSKNLYVHSTLVVNHSPDSAAPDGDCPIAGGAHCDPTTASGSPDVFVGDV